ncbi:MAG TPA: CbiX/SirB N-terminal domain-containing protein [Bacillota bacterium]|nr:CbiX/SirB N-terminal domain-containing protein [Bacillota bacterium]
MDVSPGEFANAALVLLGHGTTLNAESSAPVYSHAAELRRRHCFGEVQEAFWKQAPQVRDVLSKTSLPRLFLVPLFISEGYFSEEVIPRALGFRTPAGFSRVQRRGAQTLVYAKPVGTHENMTQVLLARAREIVLEFPFPRVPKPQESTLIIAGHGTGQNLNSRKAIERQVELIRAMRLYADVHAVFMEEEPRIADCYTLARTRHLVIVPFFISDGLHVQEDIPVLLGEPKPTVQERLQNRQPTWFNPTEKQGKWIWYAPSVGTAPLMVEVILERVREAAGWPAGELAA